MTPFQLAASLAALVLAGAPAAQDKPNDRAALGEARHLKILYAGKPGGSREKAYTEFLRGWFDSVGTTDLSKLKAADAEPFDVVVCDWSSRYGNDGYPKDMSGPGIQLPKGYTKPSILIGAVAAEVARRSLLDWL